MEAAALFWFPVRLSALESDSAFQRQCCNLIFDEIEQNYPVFLHLPRTGSYYRRFEDNEMKRSERALQIWQILISAAHNRQTLTYQIVGEITGMGSGTQSQTLDMIMRYCKRNNLPPLTSLVVQRSAVDLVTD